MCSTARRLSPIAKTIRWARLGSTEPSKLAGETAARLGNPRSAVLRTAWVLSAHRANFLKTMLKAADRPILRVVDDQQGCPDSARDIAEALKTIALRMIADPRAPTGVYHFVNGGEASWADLAREIFRLVFGAHGGVHAEVEGIPSSEYPTPARPRNSRLLTNRIGADYAIHPRPGKEAVA